MLPQSLAHMAVDQVFVAHGQVTEQVLEALWKDPSARAELTNRVLCEPRETSLCQTSHIAIVAYTTSANVLKRQRNRYVFAETAIVPAHRLPDWLFCLLKGWTDFYLIDSIKPVPRCDMGGISLPLPEPNEGLGLLWEELANGSTEELFYDQTCVGWKLWHLFELGDPEYHFEDEMAQYHDNGSNGVFDEYDPDANPLVVCAQDAFELILDLINDQSVTGESFHTFLSDNRADDKIGAHQRYQRYQSTPFLTLTVDFAVWQSEDSDEDSESGAE